MTTADRRFIPCPARLRVLAHENVRFIPCEHITGHRGYHHGSDGTEPTWWSDPAPTTVGVL